ncbi:MAG: hypothetical protein M2R45_02988 [Verrucomicrobia subdivision 3 bacterium]|nr:hypothetical protein [Limisphaerales bacterium]MCS1416526.1 hypothetical protein [Limisphaerales bacterium]
MTILGWILWGIVVSFSLGWAYCTCFDAIPVYWKYNQQYKSRNQAFRACTNAILERNSLLCTDIMTFFWWLIAVIFYFTTWNKLHILWVAPVLFFLSTFIPLRVFPIVSPLVIFTTRLFILVLLNIGVSLLILLFRADKIRMDKDTKNCKD